MGTELGLAVGTVLTFGGVSKEQETLLLLADNFLLLSSNSVLIVGVIALEHSRVLGL